MRSCASKEANNMKTHVKVTAPNPDGSLTDIVLAEWTTNPDGTHEQERERLARITEREAARRNELSDHIMQALANTTLAVQSTALCTMRDKLVQAEQLLLAAHNELHGLSTSH